MANDLRLTIIGATSELGIALADAFATKATHLHLAARRVERLEALRKDFLLKEKYQTVTLHELDVINCSLEKIQELARQTDLVITTAGYLGDQELAQQNDQEAQQILAVNFTALVRVLDPFVETFVQRQAGGIIGISSVAGERGRQSNYYYGSAKAGFTAYLSGLRNRLTSHGIHVMTVKPGFLYTRMTAHLELPPLLSAKPAAAANGIFRAWQSRRNVYYHKWLWRWIMLVIRWIPEGVFKRLKL